MSPAQKFKFFMPAWNACCKANGWHTRDKLAVVDVDKLEGEGRQVYGIARQLALREGRGVTIRDLRHACTVLCLGRDKDTDRLNNNEQDHIVALFDVLKNPMDLAARTKWEAYKRGENPGNKKRRQHFIHSRAPEAVLRHLTRDLTGGETNNFDSLDDKKEAELARLLAQRPVYGHRPELGARNAERGNGKRNYVLDPSKKFEQMSTDKR